MAHPLSQVSGLADIYHRPESVSHQVNARFMRQRRELFANVVGHGHARSKLQPLVGGWQGAEMKSEARNPKQFQNAMTSNVQSARNSRYRQMPI